jgi:hypothetical protein
VQAPSACSVQALSAAKGAELVEARSFPCITYILFNAMTAVFILAQLIIQNEDLLSTKVNLVDDTQNYIQQLNC